MPRWLVIAIEPTTCDPVIETYQWTHPVFGHTVTKERKYGCRYSVLQDGLQQVKGEILCNVERVCLAHKTISNAALGKLRWVDGNWKELHSYIGYQKKWSLWLNYMEWQAEVAAGYKSPDVLMPPTVARMSSEPPTTGNIVTPSQEQIDDMEQIYAWNQDHNDRMVTSLEIMRAELKLSTDLEREQFDEAVTWRFEGAGNTRLLYVNSGGLLNPQEKSRVESTTDIQFGPGKVVVEG